jgi:hypothetical protein
MKTNGALEYWSDGVLSSRASVSGFFFTPLFHYSTTPISS